MNKFQEMCLTILLHTLCILPSFFILPSLVLLRFFSNRESKVSLNAIIHEFKTNGRFAFAMKNTMSKLSDNCKEKFISNLLINYLVKGPIIREQKKKETGIKPPAFLALSPSMACNLKCKGCSSKNYNSKTSLKFSEIMKCLDEARSMGIYMVVILGGEPFLKKDLIEAILNKYNDMYFLIFSNGFLINDEVGQMLSVAGNAQIALSIEGFEDFTNEKRGMGAWEAVNEAMDILKYYGILFAFSVVHTKKNSTSILSDQFIDHFINKGCTLGWYFQYMPVNGEYTVSDMATPSQRFHLKHKIKDWRSHKNIALVDFHNDGPKVGGCIGGGRRFLHINSNGDAEPCIFAHFANMNIKTHSLLEILKSDFFVKWRKLYENSDGNYNRPCSIIDSPNRLREVIKCDNVKPTHKNAELIVNSREVKSGIDKYSIEIKKIMDPEWKNGDKEEFDKKYKHMKD